MKIDPKIMVAVGAMVVGVVLVVAFVSTRRSAPPVQSKTSALVASQEDTKPIPTVGPEVKVSLESVQKGKEVKLVIDGVPSGTTSIEYEFTYSTKEQESEGIFSTARPAKGETAFSRTFERQITLGTCSRNVCRYHVITSDVVVRLRFEGGYGSAIFEKNFPSSSL